MKILMTGMSSHHCKSGGNTGFFSLLYAALSELADVTLTEPRLDWARSDLQKYDAVFVGITPPTSLSANKLYAALHVLDLMYESPKLRLVLDGNQIWQYKNSFNSFKRSPMQIFSSLYSGRSGYKLAMNTKISSFESVADKMSSLEWPRTYIPMLPWADEESAATSIGFIPADNLFGVNLDSFILGKLVAPAMRNQQWAVDNINSAWWSKLSETVRMPGVSTALNKRSNDLHAGKIIAESMGTIIPPQDRGVGTWWSYRYIQSLNYQTPIVTQWQDSSWLGEDWSVLAYQVEDMPAYDRQSLADRQYKTYLSAIPETTAVLNLLNQDLLESTKERI